MQKKIGEPFFLLVIPFLVFLLMQITRRTMRITYRNREVVQQLSTAGRGCIIAFWHGRLFMSGFFYPGRKVTIMISQHRDGEYIARTASFFGFDATRGSTTKGAVSALKEILRKAREGYTIYITPDGPRGPKCNVQMGVIGIAQLTGLPIIPVSFSASRKKIFQSWDRFFLPYPFSQGVFSYGNPIVVPQNCDDSCLKQKKIELEQSLNDLTEKADQVFKK